ncbi:MAG: hypothetical protein SNG27_05375 [Rikenellaceae bacterium]
MSYPNYDIYRKVLNPLEKPTSEAFHPLYGRGLEGDSYELLFDL